MANLEPILQDNKDRFVIFPVKHHDIWDWHQKLVSGFWQPEAIGFHKDFASLDELEKEEKQLTAGLLATSFFETRLSQDFSTRFLSEVEYPEARSFYSFQGAMETVHSEVFSRILENFPKEEDKTSIFNDSGSRSFFKLKGVWVEKWLKSGSFGERLVAFAAFSSLSSSKLAFISALLQGKEVMPGIKLVCDLVLRDRKSFIGFAVHLHNNHLVNQVSKMRIKDIIFEALQLQRDFLEKDFHDASANQIQQHLEFQADQLLLSFRCEKEFNAEDPFEATGISAAKENGDLLQKRAGELKKTTASEKGTSADKKKSRL